MEVYCPRCKKDVHIDEHLGECPACYFGVSPADLEGEEDPP